MKKEISLLLKPEEAHDKILVRKLVSQRAGCRPEEITNLKYIRKSVDARKGRVLINLKVEVWIGDLSTDENIPVFKWKNVENAPEVIIVGSGPAGLFAALRFIELGIRPVILERGKEVSQRKKDIAKISREHIINPDSNYCFGEGGAGTFSDGKLYTRSKKRGDNKRILELFYLNGANQDILYDAQPHIGTDKLPGIITRIRDTIISAGGIFQFKSRVSGLIINNNSIEGVRTNKGSAYKADKVILATGHSARDIYRMMAEYDLMLEPKTFAMGVRVEHPQELIDSIQYNCKLRSKYLPAASYKLTQQVAGRGVYSFCMCPGGFIVPSATQQEELVVNGMSASTRNSPYANSGIVVEVRPEDIPLEYTKHGSLSGLLFQSGIERIAWEEGGRSQVAPAQRLDDFINGRKSVNLPSISYYPGATLSHFNEWIPVFIRDRMIEGFRSFDRKMKGFLTNEAIITAIESRSSSPVRIPRDPDTLEHVQLKGLFPVGEGSGYAGGIISSAIDGFRAADLISQNYTSS